MAVSAVANALWDLKARLFDCSLLDLLGAARGFAETEGAHIDLIARGMETLEGGSPNVDALHGNGIIIPCEVTDADGIEAAAERVEQELGPIDVWVNVAVTSLFVVVKETTATEFKRVTEVCYVGHVNGTLAALKWEGKNFEIKAR